MSSEIPSVVQDLLSVIEPTKKVKKGKHSKDSGFSSFDLPQPILNALNSHKFKKPTPIQQKAIPLLLTGRDVVLMSRTGSGKTLSFIIPMLKKLGSHKKEVGARGLIISPTRELAMQTYKVTKSLISKEESIDFRICALLGGDSMDSQFTQLASNPDIIIATPGRLVHLLDIVKSFSLSTIQYVVFDEADRLFEMGFKFQMEEILKNIPHSQSRQVVLVSATLPKALAEFAQVGLQDPATIRLDVEEKLPPDLKICYITSKTHERWGVFLHIIKEIIPENEMTLIFVATRHHAEFLYTFMKKIGYDPAMIYGKMDFEARKLELEAFEEGRKKYLIVTDVAARGIDIPLLNNVINVHFPGQPKLFLHRVGRAARAGRRGVAISIVTPEEFPYYIELLKFLDKPMISMEGEIDLKEDSKGENNNDENDEEENGEDNDSMSDDEIKELKSNKPMTESEKKALFDENMELILQTKDNYESIINQFDGYYGSVPSIILQPDLDYFAKELGIDNTLQAQLHTATCAYKLYKKTRAAPSASSLRQSRDLFNSSSDVPPHPICAKKLGSKQNIESFQRAQEFTRAISNYKPKLTIFEQTRGTKEYEVMQRLRLDKAFKNYFKSSIDKNKKQDSELIPNQNQIQISKSENEPKTLAEKILARANNRSKDQLVIENEFHGKYRDDSFYMSYEPEIEDDEKDDERHYKINDLSNMNQHIFSLQGEDQEDIQKEQRQRVWDKKKRQYVYKHLLAGQRLGMNNKIKNEAGVYVARKNLEDDKAYTKWRQKSGARIQKVGEIEDSFQLPDTVLMTRKARNELANQRKKEKQDKEQLLKKLNITESHYQHRLSKQGNEIKNEAQIQKEKRSSENEKRIDDIKKRVKLLGKKKVGEELAQENLERGIKKINDRQKIFSQKRKAEKIKRRDNKRRRIN